MEWHSRLLEARDGSTYLSYPVSVGRFKTESAAFQQLSPEALAAHKAGNLDLGKLSQQLSEYAQDTRKSERDQSARKTVPEGSTAMSAWQEHETIFILFANGLQAKVDLNTVSNVFFSASGPQPSLYFRHECSWEIGLPLDSPGTDGILQYIRRLPAFDESAFQATLTRKD